MQTGPLDKAKLLRLRLKTANYTNIGQAIDLLILPYINPLKSFIMGEGFNMNSGGREPVGGSTELYEQHRKKNEVVGTHHRLYIEKDAASRAQNPHLTH